LIKDLVEHLRSTLPMVQDQVLNELNSPRFGLTPKDALTLINLDNGERLEYYHDTVCRLESLQGQAARQGVGKLAGNW
jgi:aspartyl-tRNA(Asn)/glutamyl-tRNA(Gln) amidotransferase subunit B